MMIWSRHILSGTNDVSTRSTGNDRRSRRLFAMTDGRPADFFPSFLSLDLHVPFPLLDRVAQKLVRVTLVVLEVSFTVGTRVVVTQRPFTNTCRIKSATAKEFFRSKNSQMPTLDTCLLAILV